MGRLQLMQPPPEVYVAQQVQTTPVSQNGEQRMGFAYEQLPMSKVQLLFQLTTVTGFEPDRGHYWGDGAATAGAACAQVPISPVSHSGERRIEFL